MTLPIIFRPEADDDVIEARDWYERKQSGLGDQFSDALEDVIAIIKSNPKLYAATYADVRRAKLKRFPYVVYYRILTHCVEVLAVIDGRRDPQVWQSRA